MAEGRSTFHGRDCRIVMDNDAVAVRIRGGFYIVTIERGRPIVQSISDKDMEISDGRAIGRGLDTDADNLIDPQEVGA